MANLFEVKDPQRLIKNNIDNECRAYEYMGNFLECNHINMCSIKVHINEHRTSTQFKSLENNLASVGKQIEFLSQFLLNTNRTYRQTHRRDRPTNVPDIKLNGRGPNKFDAKIL